MYKLIRHSSSINKNRDEWCRQRKSLEETLAYKSTKKRKTIQKLSRIFPISLFDSIGRKNILKIQHNEISFHFKNLPESFNGFSILHISDPHFGADTLLNETICEAASKAKADLTILTGNYQFGYGTVSDLAFNYVDKLVKASASPLPTLAILGNHDRTEMIE